VNFFEFMLSASARQSQQPEVTEKKKEMSNNLRIILLAIRLQRMVKNLPSHLVSAERITHASLASHYYDMGLSHTLEGALKMAHRDMDYLESVFGLEGSDHAGYVMGTRFDRFYDMFESWLAALGEPNPSNRRLHILLNGLMRSIESGFRDDPIIIPDLARELKQEFGNKNLRDSREPLTEMLSNDTIAGYLQLIDADNERLRIDKSKDPLLMRLRSRNEVGDNCDISINLARPGRIRASFHEHLDRVEPTQAELLKSLAESVRHSHLWQDEKKNMVVPYILYQEGKEGPYMLTLWSESTNGYFDIAVDDIRSFPHNSRSKFIPHDMPEKLWEQFRQTTA